MNLNEWENSIFSVINEIGDENYQKAVWFERVEEEQSSFTEIMCSLYDEYEFESYIDRQSNGKPLTDEFITVLKSFNQEVNQFLEVLGGQSVTVDLLEDPKWKSIQAKAKKLCELKDNKGDTH